MLLKLLKRRKWHLIEDAPFGVAGSIELYLSKVNKTKVIVSVKSDPLGTILSGAAALVCECHGVNEYRTFKYKVHCTVGSSPAGLITTSNALLSSGSK